MSRSVLPGVTVDQAALTVQVISVSWKRKGESDASAAVLPENESLRTAIWLVIIVVRRARSAAERSWSETT